MYRDWLVVRLLKQLNEVTIGLEDYYFDLDISLFDDALSLTTYVGYI